MLTSQNELLQHLLEGSCIDSEQILQAQRFCAALLPLTFERSLQPLAPARKPARKIICVHRFEGAQPAFDKRASAQLRKRALRQIRQRKRRTLHKCVVCKHRVQPFRQSRAVKSRVGEIERLNMRHSQLPQRAVAVDIRQRAIRKRVGQLLREQRPQKTFEHHRHLRIFRQRAHRFFVDDLILQNLHDHLRKLRTLAHDHAIFRKKLADRNVVGEISC